MARSRIQKEKAKHRAGLLKRLALRGYRAPQEALFTDQPSKRMKWAVEFYNKIFLK